jgi:hypothetical protein
VPCTSITSRSPQCLPIGIGGSWQATVMPDKQTLLHQIISHPQW